MTETPGQEKKTCGECARFKIPHSGCTYSSDIAKGIVSRNDEACSDFYPKQKGKANQPRKTFKDSGICLDGCYEAIYNNGKPAFLMKAKEGFNVYETLENDGKTIYPKEASQFPYKPFGYYRGEVASREDLFWKVRNEFDTFIDVEPIWKDVLAACVPVLSARKTLHNTIPVSLWGQ